MNTPGYNYYRELTLAMDMLAEQPNTIFLGQGVGCPGTTMSGTFDNVPAEKKIEFPVAEDLQAGVAIGLSLEGMVPICVYPRWNFMLCAANQIINHLDRIPIYSTYAPKAIIRVAVPSTHPFYPGPQHDDDFSMPFKSMLRTTDVVRLNRADQIVERYWKAYNSPRSTVLVEFTDLYREELANR